MDDMPTDKEGFDAWRAGRTLSKVAVDDAKFAMMVKQYEKRPEWARFMSDIGPQAERLDNRTLLAAFLQWDEERKNEKPDWLKELDTHHEEFPVDDRNDAMGAAPQGQVLSKPSTRTRGVL